MIILKSIQLKNFLSHSNTSIRFDNPCKILIDGKSGSGKSSIVDALTWCLYNKSRVDGRSLIKHGAKEAKITVILEEDPGTQYKIERSITSKGKHFLSIEQKNVESESFAPISLAGKRDQQKYLENNILKSSYLLFINSIVYPQDNIESFVKQTATKRKEMILEIARASNYDDYYKKASEKIVEYENKKDHFTNVSKMINESVEEDKKILENKEVTKKTLMELSDKITKQKENIKVLAGKEVDRLILTSALHEKQDQFESAKRKIEALNKEIGFAEINLAKLGEEEITNAKKNINDLEKNKKTLVKLNNLKNAGYQWNTMMLQIMEEKPFNSNINDVEDITKSLKSLKNEKIEFCSELNKPCPIIQREHNKRIADLEEILIKSKKEIEDYNKRTNEYNAKVESLGPKPNVDLREIDVLNETIKAQEELKAWISENEKNNEMKRVAIKSVLVNNRAQMAEQELLKMRLNDEISNLTKEIDKSIDVSNDKILAERALEQNEGSYRNTLILLGEIENAEKRIENNKKKLEEVEKGAKDAETLLVALYAIKEAFSNNGIKSMIVDWLIPRLEDRINEILSKLSDFRIHMDTQKMSVSGESTIEGLYIDIINEKGEMFNFENFSGGEKIKVCAAIFEGLASFQSYAFRVLDESIVSLDNESTSQFISVLKNVQKNISQLIVISHIQEVKDYFSDKINIAKINGNSKIN